MTIMPSIPDEVTVVEMEEHLDRLALEITGSEYGEEYLPLYAWLEGQLNARKAANSTMASVLNRVRQSSHQTAARS